MGFLAVNITSFAFAMDGATVTGLPGGRGTMSGAATTCPTGSFNVSLVNVGLCPDTHQLVGAFTGTNTWSGTYTLTFGGGPGCFDCTNQSFPVTAIR